MYRVTASKVLAGQNRFAMWCHLDAAESVALLAALRAEGWTCHAMRDVDGRAVITEVRA